MEYMYEKKQKSSKVRALLNKCTFIATYSNANVTREKNAALGSMFYFALTPLDTVLNNCVKGKVGDAKEILLCLSNYDTPYYKQIDEYFITDKTTVQKVTVDKLTKEILNTFASSGGYIVIAALDSEEEYNSFCDVMNSSSYRKLVNFIELLHPEIVKEKLIGFSNIQSCSSGVCINGTGYVGLNTIIPYEVCAAVLTVCWRSWSRFEEARVLSLT
jgi:hypothetical protein